MIPATLESAPARRRRRIVLLGAAAAALGLLAGLHARRAASVRAAYASAVVQLDTMRLDAQAIRQLQTAPQTAVARRKPNEELLGQVEQALGRAGIAREQWRDSVPQPAARLPGGDYRRQTTALFFDGLSLQQLSALVVHLQGADATLRVSRLALSQRGSQSTVYDAEIGLSYLIYAPQGDGLRDDRGQ